MSLAAEDGGKACARALLREVALGVPWGSAL